jgi:hypothetical protein
MTRSARILTAAALLSLPLASLPGADARADHVQGHDGTARGWIQELDARVDVLEATPDADTLGSLVCSAGQIAKFDGAAWVCAADQDTSAADCPAGQVLVSDGNGGQCVELPAGGGPAFQRILVVGGAESAAANCEALQAALARITDNGPDSPYLIKLEPGVYDCGLGSVVMKSHVDIEGSGRATTRISGAGNSFDGGTRTLAGVVTGAENSELRGLTVEHRGGPEVPFAIAISNQAKDMRITDVLARVSAPGAGFSGGIVMADLPGIAYIDDVRVTTPPGAASGITITPLAEFFAGDLLINNAIVESGTALRALAAGVIIRNSLLFATFSAILSDSGSRTSVVTTGLFGEATGSVFLCVGAYDQFYQPLDGSCGASSLAAATAESAAANPFALSP